MHCSLISITADVIATLGHYENPNIQCSKPHQSRPNTPNTYFCRDAMTRQRPPQLVQHCREPLTCPQRAPSYGDHLQETSTHSSPESRVQEAWCGGGCCAEFRVILLGEGSRILVPGHRRADHISIFSHEAVPALLPYSTNRHHVYRSF